MLIGFGKNMTCIDLRFTRSKVKVTRVFFCEKRCLVIFLRTIHHRAFIFHKLIGLGKDMTPIDFGFTSLKVKVTKVTYKK